MQQRERYHTSACCAAGFNPAYVCSGSRPVIPAMSARCPVCPKADTAGRFMNTRP